MKPVAKEFLGSGWRFPVEIGNRGGIDLSEGEQKIQESIRIILGTAKGERVMRPEFGCDIHKFTFSVINTSTRTMIQSAVREALVLFEPRIEVMNVTTSTEGLGQGELSIHVDYKVRSTNYEFNLVYPFYLNPGG